MNGAAELSGAFPEGQSAETYAAQMSAMTLSDPSIAPPHTPATANAPEAPKADATTTTPSAGDKPQRPDHIPEKFWDAESGTIRVEELAKSYAELEKGRAPKPEARPTAKIEKPEGGSEADPATATEGAETPEAKTEEPKAADPAALTSAIEAAKTAYAADGKVTPELVEGLVKAGLPQDAVEMYFAGLQAYEASIITAAHTAAGGQEQFEAMTGWAAKNLSDADLDYYNGLVSSPANTVRAVEWLAAKYGAQNPSEGRFVQGQAPSAGDTYASSVEMTKDMQSPQYQSDPAFRQRVAEKVQRSYQAGTLNQSVQYFG
ncbi:hypothetical protein JIX59_03565 [Brevundimonas diminuta]|uniref:capsid assembly protein n=1 Tax=Brevundimonas diminuta TaxID=293 RepID=UPI0019084A48|nr:hypothetical protein [Brevundimonas diminuta]MBK1968410.1 hypothetical protein [Brevundimonas diminuta]